MDKKIYYYDMLQSLLPEISLRDGVSSLNHLYRSSKCAERQPEDGYAEQRIADWDNMVE
jgi:hypothetical protein